MIWQHLLSPNFIFQCNSYTTVLKPTCVSTVQATILCCQPLISSVAFLFGDRRTNKELVASKQASYCDSQISQRLNLQFTKVNRQWGSVTFIVLPIRDRCQFGWHSNWRDINQDRKIKWGMAVRRQLQCNHILFCNSNDNNDNIEINIEKKILRDYGKKWPSLKQMYLFKVLSHPRTKKI